MTRLQKLRTSCAVYIVLVSAIMTTTAVAQIESVDVTMLSGSEADFGQVVLEPLQFQRSKEKDPRNKVSRKSFVGTLVFEKDHDTQTADGFVIVKTITSSCGVTAAYDSDKLLSGVYDVKGYTADHCLTENKKISFDRAVAYFPGANKTYNLLPADFTPSYQTNDFQETYPFDWGLVELPEDAELQAVSLYKGDYRGPVVFESSTKGYTQDSSQKRVTQYVATSQKCVMDRRYSDYSSDKVTNCRTAKAMSGGGFFVPDSYELVAVLSRVGEATLYSYATQVSAFGKKYNPVAEYHFQVANLHLYGKKPALGSPIEKSVTTSIESTTKTCLSSDGTSLVNTMMLRGVSYQDAKKFC